MPTFRAVRSMVGLDETNRFWYENPGWERHDVAFAPHLDVGATLCDVTGDGRPTVVAGQGPGTRTSAGSTTSRTPESGGAYTS